MLDHSQLKLHSESEDCLLHGMRGRLTNYYDGRRAQRWQQERSPTHASNERVLRITIPVLLKPIVLLRDGTTHSERMLAKIFKDIFLCKLF
jgi:hypothetical protein